MDLSKNKIPLKIEDDGLKDTIVLVKYTTEYNLQKLESVVKVFLDSIPNTNFTKINTRKEDVEGIVDSPDKDSKFFYTDGIYKIIVKSDEIAFNCVAAYTGWNNYSDFILGCLKSIEDFIQGYRVSIRYISFYPNLPLYSFVDGEFNYPNLTSDIKEQIHLIKCDLKRENEQLYGIGIVRLYDLVYIQNQKQSIFDVEIQSTDFNIQKNNFDAINAFLQDGHIYEKRLFYSLLTEEYVNSKNPTYE